MFIHKHFSGGEPIELSEIDDVALNLLNVLGSKRGTGYFLPKFGLSGPGFRTPEETVVLLTDELRENIEQYEPRVEIIDIKEGFDEAGRPSELVVRLRLRSTQARLRVIANFLKQDVVVKLDVAPSKAETRGR